MTVLAIKKFINSYPMVFGAFLGLLIIFAVIITETWFPWIAEDLGRHKRLAEAALYTAFAFGVCAYTFRRWRYRSPHMFWASLTFFFLLHALGVFLYSIYVGPILGWQWMILLYLEGYLASFFVGWSTRRFSRLDRHAPAQHVNESSH